MLAIWYGRVPAEPGYDAWLHALFLGFVFAMIFGHAPIIFPSVLQLPVVFHHRFYAHLGLLHASLLVRVVGDVAGLWAWRRWGGLLNVLAILIFLANTVYTARAAPHPAPVRGWEPREGSDS